MIICLLNISKVDSLNTYPHIHYKMEIATVQSAK